jgi:competence protein ComEC
LARVLAWFPWLLLAYTTRVVEWTAQPSWASVELRFTGWMALLFYALLAGGLWLIRPLGGRAEQERTRRAPRIAALVALALVAALVWIAALGAPDGRLHVVFLDVGQGDAILIQTPHGEQALIDGGAEPSRLLDALGRRLPFWDRTLELVALSHADMDHLGGLIAALERYRVGKVLQTEAAASTSPLERWQELIRQRHVQVIPAQAGLRLSWADGVWLECLHPAFTSPSKASDNNSSIVLRLSYGQSCFLLTGDIESEAEAQLLASGRLSSCQVLKVSHHGAAEASTAPLLAAIQPQLAVISVGQGNRYGHPAASTLQRLQESGARILRTDQRGDIEIISDGNGLEIRTGK